MYYELIGSAKMQFHKFGERFLLLSLCCNCSQFPGNHSDGQYQCSGFKETLTARCGAQDPDVEYPVIWDVAHWMDLAIKKSRDKNKPFLLFLKRINAFSEMFGRGRGKDEFLAMQVSLQVKATAVSNFSVTRFVVLIHFQYNYLGATGLYKT